MPAIQSDDAGARAAEQAVGLADFAAAAAVGQQAGAAVHPGHGAAAGMPGAVSQQQVVFAHDREAISAQPVAGMAADQTVGAGYRTADVAIGEPAGAAVHPGGRACLRCRAVVP